MIEDKGKITLPLDEYNSVSWKIHEKLFQRVLRLTIAGSNGSFRYHQRYHGYPSLTNLLNQTDTMFHVST